MKPIETHPDYAELLESFEYEICLRRDIGDYQGDTHVLFRDGERYGYLAFGWGSCSLCDALEGCRDLQEVEELRQGLHEAIRWGSREELLTWFQSRDWTTHWYSSAPGTQDFVREALTLLKGADLEAAA